MKNEQSHTTLVSYYYRNYSLNLLCSVDILIIYWKFGIYNLRENFPFPQTLQKNVHLLISTLIDLINYTSSEHSTVHSLIRRFSKVHVGMTQVDTGQPVIWKKCSVKMCKSQS